MFGRIKTGLHCSGCENDGDGSTDNEVIETADREPQAVSEDYEEEARPRDPEGRQYTPSPQKNNASYLMGEHSSGVSLDGRSLVVPVDREFDEVSSINTAQYGYANELRILGAVEQEGDVENRNYEGPIEQSPTDDRKNGRYEYHAARPKRDEKTLDTEYSYEGGCLPLWITDAPKWLKIVIVLSTAMLVGAIVLIGVGAALAVQKNKSAESVQGNPISPTVPISPSAPVAPPVSAPIDVGGAEDPPTVSPTTASTEASTESATVAPAPTPTAIDTNEPPVDESTPAPVGSPTQAPVDTSNVTAAPTNAPTAAPTSSTVTFYVTGGRFTGQALVELPDQLPTLPEMDGNAVMFHLGDWNSPFATSCVEDSYQVNVDLFSQSSVPVYFVPGDNEYNDCPEPEQAFTYWKQYLLDYETQFWPAPDMWNVTRQVPQRPENFSYVYNRILFVGINLVGGVVLSNREWEERHAANLLWIEEQYYLNQGDFDVLLVLAHADPALQANDNFFETFYDRVQNEYTLQVIFVHRNLGVESWGLEPAFNGIGNLMVVTVEGNIWPPMMLQVDPRAGTVDIDQGEWYEDYIATNDQNA